VEKLSRYGSIVFFPEHSMYSPQRCRVSWTIPSPRRKTQPIRLTLEALEERLVLSTSSAAAAQLGQFLTGLQTMSQAAASGEAAVADLIVLHADGSPSPMSITSASAYMPSQIQQAYGFNQIAFRNGTVLGNGAGQTIAIVDPYNDPNISSDLQAFDAQFGLPNANLRVVGQSGGAVPAADPTGYWELEESLDVEWAHAVAPGANIVLVEANSSNLSDLMSAVRTAAKLPGVSVVALTWSTSEYSGVNNYDSVFTTPAGHQGVTFVASSGDQGALSYPASSPNVLAVGGTSLSLNGAGGYGGETAWSGSGGGVSALEGEPSYQRSVQNTGKRTSPDVAYNADPTTGYFVYDSYGNSSPWMQVGGTSAAAPQWAGLIAIANQGRALAGKGTLNGSTQTLPMIYGMSSSAFHDITSGSNYAGYSAGPGYDEVTGRGSPYANLVVAALSQQTVTAPPGSDLPAGTPPLPVYWSSPTAPLAPVSFSPTPPPSPLQLFLDGISLTMVLEETGSVSAVLSDAALMHDIDAGGGFYNPYLDAGIYAALSGL
jgi:subtilase family serine protease